MELTHLFRRPQPIFVCSDFSRWFRRRFGGELADLQDVWEAIDRPSWMLWVTMRSYVPAELRCLMADCLDRIRAVGPFSLGEARREPALARQLRQVMPGELLEALLWGAGSWVRSSPARGRTSGVRSRPSLGRGGQQALPLAESVRRSRSLGNQ